MRPDLAHRPEAPCGYPERDHTRCPGSSSTVFSSPTDTWIARPLIARSSRRKMTLLSPRRRAESASVVDVVANSAVEDVRGPSMKISPGAGCPRAPRAAHREGASHHGGRTGPSSRPSSARIRARSCNSGPPLGQLVGYALIFLELVGRLRSGSPSDQAVAGTTRRASR